MDRRGFLKRLLVSAPAALSAERLLASMGQRNFGVDHGGRVGAGLIAPGRRVLAWVNGPTSIYGFSAGLHCDDRDCEPAQVFLARSARRDQYIVHALLHPQTSYRYEFEASQVLIVPPDKCVRLYCESKLRIWAFGYIMDDHGCRPVSPRA